MSKNNSLKNRYKLASLKVLNDYPTWKKIAVTEDLKDNKDTRLTNEYAKDVATIAEDDSISLTE